MNIDGWHWDSPYYATDDTWCGFDDPDAAPAIQPVDTFVILPDAVYSRLHLTIFGESVGCLGVEAFMTLLNSLDLDGTFDAEITSEQTLMLTVEQEQTCP